MQNSLEIDRQRQQENFTTTTLLQEIGPPAFVVVFDCLAKRKKCQSLKAFQATGN